MLSSCVSHYRGKGPDFSLKGEAARREVVAFSLDEGFFDHGTKVLQMGPEHPAYTLSSLEPIIADVSPRATAEIERAQSWQVVAWGLLGGALGVLVTSKSNPQWEAAYYSLLAGSLGVNFYANSIMSDAAEDYNNDLRARFAPKISWVFEY